MPSLKSIAKELNISYSLVSKVLSGRMGTTGVSAKTREAILTKVRELDYKPNHLAVALKGGRKATIGVFLHHTGVASSEITDQFIRGLSSVLDKTNTRMLLRFFTYDKEFLGACDSDLKSDVDGLILGGALHPKLIEKLKRIDDEGLPIVAAFDDMDPAAWTRIVHARIDYRLQTYLTTRHLLELGCRRIAHMRKMDSRYQGFVQALREWGMVPDPALVLATPGFEVAHGAAAAQKLFAQGLPCDGLVCQSDAQAFGAINFFSTHEIDVPGRIKVTGVDDSPLAAISPISITTSTSSMRELGARAVELLLRRIEGHAAESLTIAPRLMVRASTGG